MNDTRRKTIAELAVKIAAIRDELDQVREEEADAFENLPQSFQDSTRGEEQAEGIGSLEEAVAGLEAVNDSLGTLGDFVETALANR